MSEQKPIVNSTPEVSKAVDTAYINPQTKGGAKQVSALAKVIKDSPDLEFVAALKGDGETVMSFVAEGDSVWKKELRASLIDSLTGLLDEQRLIALNLSVFSDPSWESTAEALSLNVPRIMKAKREIARANPNSVTRLISCYVVEEGTAKLIFVPMLVTLRYELSGETRAAGRGRASKRSTPQPRGPRPTIIPESVPSPLKDDIVRMVARFIEAERALRKAAADLARQTSQSEWAASREHRAIGTAQLKSLVPAAKATFGCGEGEQVVKRALIKPEQRARDAKKTKASLDRFDAYDAWWCDAYKNPTTRLRPPYIKL